MPRHGQRHRADNENDSGKLCVEAVPALLAILRTEEKVSVQCHNPAH
jgi:hypothetical protein